jgi:hypothetical protein
MRLAEALAAPQTLYDASRPLMRRQMRGSRILAAAMFACIPLSVILGALNSPLCVMTTIAALFSPFALLMVPGLRRASTEPLELYSGKLVPVPESTSAVLTIDSSTTPNVLDVLLTDHSTPPRLISYWVTMDIEQAYRIDSDGTVTEFTPEKPRQSFRLFPRLNREIGNQLLPDQPTVLAVTRPLKWIFLSPVVLGRLDDLTTS